MAKTPRAYDPSEHPQPAVTVDVVLFTVREGALEVLLVRRALPPFRGDWALPGGFVRIDESLEDAARRELSEETDLEVRWLEQLYTFGDLGRDPARRVITVAYFALVDAAQLDPTAGTDASEVQWRALGALPKLAFDHGRIVDRALRRLRYKTEYAPVALSLLASEFTLRELQDVYEVIHGRAIDKRNFRRKLLALGVVEPTGESRVDGPGRPAALFRFDRARFEDLGDGVHFAF